MYRAAQGHTGIAELQRRSKAPLKAAARKKSGKDLFGNPKPGTKPGDESTDDGSDREEEKDWEAIKDRFRVFYPSDQTVKDSPGGPDFGGTICFNRSWWSASTFPQGIVRDCKSVREGILMHNKVC